MFKITAVVLIISYVFATFLHIYPFAIFAGLSVGWYWGTRIAYDLNSTKDHKRDNEVSIYMAFGVVLSFVALAAFGKLQDFSPLWAFVPAMLVAVALIVTPHMLPMFKNVPLPEVPVKVKFMPSQDCNTFWFFDAISNVSIRIASGVIGLMALTSLSQFSYIEGFIVIVSFTVSMLQSKTQHTGNRQLIKKLALIGYLIALVLLYLSSIISWIYLAYAVIMGVSKQIWASVMLVRIYTSIESLKKQESLLNISLAREYILFLGRLATSLVTGVVGYFGGLKLALDVSIVLGIASLLGMYWASSKLVAKLDTEADKAKEIEFEDAVAVESAGGIQEIG